MSDQKTTVFRKAIGVVCSKCGSKHVGVIDWPREKVKCMVCGLEGFAFNPNQFLAEIYKKEENGN